MIFIKQMIELRRNKNKMGTWNICAMPSLPKQSQTSRQSILLSFKTENYVIKHEIQRKIENLIYVQAHDNMATIVLYL